jgi:hypothetical protein
MAETLTSPTEAVLEEHRRLRVALAELETAACTPPGFLTRGSLIARLAVARHRLADHFAGEEQQGLFGRLAQALPERAVDCERLRREHATLLHRLDRLQETAPADPVSEAARRAWHQALRSLLVDVDGHEQRETALLLESVEGGGGAPD